MGFIVLVTSESGSRLLSLVFILFLFLGEN